MRKVILKELSKKLKLNKCYMLKPESLQENETREILWDFEIQMDHPILNRKLDLVLTNKKRELVVEWIFRVEIRNQSDKRLLEPCQRTYKTVKHKGDDDTNYSWCTWDGPQSLGKGTRKSRN